MGVLVPVGEPLEALVQTHRGCPIKAHSGLALIEPMRGGQLFSQEAGKGRLAVANLPNPLRDSARPISRSERHTSIGSR